MKGTDQESVYFGRSANQQLGLLINLIFCNLIEMKKRTELIFSYKTI